MICPQWFQAELTRVGGINPYGEPVFRMVWSADRSQVAGGCWEQDGATAYRKVFPNRNEDCWCLEVWEPRETQGSSERWQRDFRDDSGLLQCGAYPKYGQYRLLQKFIHREIVSQAKERHWMEGPHIKTEIIQKQEVRRYTLQPCGLLLDIMIPMLIHWQRLDGASRVTAIKQDEKLRKEEFIRKVKDARDGCRVMRGSALVRRRAEIIEKGMRQAMAIASRMGLGLRVGG